MEHAILALLKADPRDQWSPKELATALRCSASSVRKALCRLSRRRTYEGFPFITTKNGRYRAWVGRDELDLIERPDLELHAIQGSCTLPPNRGRGARVAARQEGPFAWTYNDVADQHTGKASWEGRSVTVAVSSTGTVQVSLEASRKPLSFLEHEMFWAWVQGALTGAGILWVQDFAVLDNVEVNQDYKRLALAGGKGRRVMLRQWRNGWAQHYQKQPYRLRSEFRWAKDEAEVVSIQEAMSWGPPKPPEAGLAIEDILVDQDDEIMFQ